MAKSVSVGSLRFDIVTNAQGMVTGLRKARKEMDKTQRAAKRGGGMRGAAASKLGLAARMVGGMIGRHPVIAAFAGAAVAINRMTKAANENARAVEQLAQQTRARGVQGRTLQQQQILNAAQRDPFARGPEAAAARMRARGTLITAGQAAAGARLTQSQQELAESAAALKAAVAEYFTPALITFNKIMAKFLDGTRKFVEGAQNFGRAYLRYQGGALGGRVDELEMMRRLRNQVQSNRLTQRRTADLAGNLPGAQTAAAGSAAEYQFFVRRQQRERNEELELQREQNRLLTELVRNSEPQNQTNPTTGEREVVVGVGD